MGRLQEMTTAELSDLVGLFPWFGAARMELSKRQILAGEELLADAALYAGSRAVLFDLERSLTTRDYRDKDIQRTIAEAPVRKVRSVGGDFFSQDQYDDVRQEGDAVLGTIVANLPVSEKEEDNDDILLEFCTETLAQIYADQGYYKQARYIYSKLLLRYPEKSAYFAALIEKLKELERN